MVYVIVGSVSAIIDLLTLRILLSLNTPQWPAVTIAFIAGFVFNLKSHALFTFVSAITKKSALRFTSLVGVNYLLTLAIIETLSNFSFTIITAKVISLPVIAISGYLLGRYWAFKA
jgi:putative flippase GtrA